MEKIKKAIYLILGIMLYVLAASGLSGLNFSSFARRWRWDKVLQLLIVCLVMYIGGKLLCKAAENHKRQIVKANLFIWLAVYAMLFIYLTLVGKSFGRGGFRIPEWNMELLRNYIARSFNIIPFATVSEYVVKFIRGEMPLPRFMYNTLGNLGVLMPLSVLLPLLFDKQKKFKNFAVTILVIVLCVELLQFATRSGVFDIDDIILNSLGAYLAFGILQTKPMKRLITRLFPELF